MSAWNHAICDDCWDRDHPDRPSPRRGTGDEEACCSCGAETTSGIYLRADPASLACKGQGFVHDVLFYSQP